jgi:hypothetical protein
MTRTRRTPLPPCHLGPSLTVERKLHYVQLYLNGEHTTKHAAQLVRSGQARSPSEVFAIRTLSSWVRAHLQKRLFRAILETLVQCPTLDWIGLEVR